MPPPSWALLPSVEVDTTNQSPLPHTIIKQSTSTASTKLLVEENKRRPSWDTTFRRPRHCLLLLKLKRQRQLQRIVKPPCTPFDRRFGIPPPRRGSNHNQLIVVTRRRRKHPSRRNPLPVQPLCFSTRKMPSIRLVVQVQVVRRKATQRRNIPSHRCDEA